jgi:predicted DNA-binding protein (MmcQ/YjbR family)
MSRSDYDEPMDLCAAMVASELSYPFGEGAAVFKVGDRIFAIIGEGDPVRISLKVDPEDARALVNSYAEVTPGYHLNKKHWITVSLPAPTLPLGELIRDSYDLIVASLPRARRPSP